jgi:branched-chain amino acid transport system permease protein
MMALGKRELLMFGFTAIVLGLVFAWLGAAYTVRMLAEASCYALLALGLNIQWGYAGLFNAGVMGFVAVGGFMTMLISYPVNQAFWASAGPGQLAKAAFFAVATAVVAMVLHKIRRKGLSPRLTAFAMVMVIAVGYLLTIGTLDPATQLIEKEAGFIGGLGLPVWFGWLVGGIAAGAISYFIGKICLGLRSDYLAIATLGIAEIIKAVLKNADWLTRGTLTVSPLPWPVPTPDEVGFIAARSAYLAVTATLMVIIFIAVQRAYRAPWGRMMRAIRDNEISAGSMGKDVNRRRLEIFVFGSVVMGVAGAALVSFSRIFDPSGFIPLNHTFLVWVMVILGGSGNNLGAIFGALLVYIIWTMSEPAALFLFELIRAGGESMFDWQAPADLNSRALQMRVFVIGLTITLVLRFAPQGLLPEKTAKFD